MEVLATNQKNLMTLQCEKSDYDKYLAVISLLYFLEVMFKVKQLLHHY